MMHHYSIKKVAHNGRIGSRILYNLSRQAFSAAAADQKQPQQTLIYGKRCEHGQSNQFMLRATDYEKPHVDVSYSTFWNDFSHYSLYRACADGEAPLETPLNYDDLSTFHELFENKAKYVDFDESAADEVNFEQSTFKEHRFQEKLTIAPKQKSNLFAHIPQDFNLDLETCGHIRGVNLGDSKYLGSHTRFVTHGQNSVVSARRVRTDDCYIKTVNGPIDIGSYVESQTLLMETMGDIHVAKRVGIAVKGEILQKCGGGTSGSRPLIKIGSLFSNMASLPAKKFNDFELNFENEYNFLRSEAAKGADRGLILNTNGAVTIDNVQGVLTICQDAENPYKMKNPQDTHKINLVNVESGLLHIDAPDAEIELTLKSLHDSSYIRCKSLTIYVSDDFFQSNILDCSALNATSGNQGGGLELSSYLDSMDEIVALDERKPTLYVDAVMNCKVHVLSQFEILKMQIMSKMKDRSGGGNATATTQDGGRTNRKQQWMDIQLNKTK